MENQQQIINQYTMIHTKQNEHANSCKASAKNCCDHKMNATM